VKEIWVGARLKAHNLLFADFLSSTVLNTYYFKL